MLSRDAILALDDLPRERVDVPEWGTYVYVRAMSGADRMRLEKLLRDSDGVISRGALVVFLAVDEKGNRLFTDEDVEALEAKHSGALERIAGAALTFNAMDAEAVETEKND
jgi:hypothetical protein